MLFRLRPLAVGLILLCVVQLSGQTSPPTEGIFYSPDRTRVTLVTKPLVLVDQSDEYLELSFSGRHKVEDPIKPPESIEAAFFSRAVAHRFGDDHRLTVWTDGVPLDLGRTTYQEFQSTRTGGFRPNDLNGNPALSIARILPSGAKLAAKNREYLIGETMARDGLTLDQLIWIAGAKLIEIQIGSIKVAASQRLPGRDYRYVRPTIEYSVRLVDLAPEFIEARPAEKGSEVNFFTRDGLRKIRVVTRDNLGYRQSAKADPETYYNSGSFWLRDGRLAPQFVEAFAYAITLCRQQP